MGNRVREVCENILNARSFVICYNFRIGCLKQDNALKNITRCCVFRFAVSINLL